MTRKALLTMCGCLVLAVALMAQTADQARFAKVAITSTASDALSMVGGITTSTSLSGTLLVNARNNFGGTTGVTEVRLGNDASAFGVSMGALSSGFTTTGFYIPNSAYVIGSLSSGITVGTDHASGDLRLAAGGTTRATLKAAGQLELPNGLSVGAGATVTKVLTATTTWNPANLQVDDGFDSVTLAMVGVTSTSPCVAAFSAALGTNVILSARYDAADTVRAIVVNTNTGLAYDPGSGTVRVTCFVY